MSHPVHTTSSALIAAASVCVRVCVCIADCRLRGRQRESCVQPPNTERRNSQHRPGTERKRKSKRERERERRRNKQRVGGENVCVCICMWSLRGHVCTSEPSACVCVCVYSVWRKKKMFLPPVSCNKPAHDLVCMCMWENPRSVWKMLWGEFWLVYLAICCSSLTERKREGERWKIKNGELFQTF